MDKIIDIPSRARKVYRFQCDCLTSQDALTIEVEGYGEGNKVILFTLDFYHNDLGARLKYAWQIVRGHWTWREFVPRKEDYQHISELLSPGKKFNELP